MWRSLEQAIVYSGLGLRVRVNENVVYKEANESTCLLRYILYLISYKVCG